MKNLIAVLLIAIAGVFALFPVENESPPHFSWMHKVAQASELVKNAEGFFYEIVALVYHADSDENVIEIVIATHVFEERNDPELGIIPEGKIVNYSITDPQEIVLVLSDSNALKIKAEEFAALSIEKTKTLMAAEKAKELTRGTSKKQDASSLNALIESFKVEEQLKKN